MRGNFEVGGCGPLRTYLPLSFGGPSRPLIILNTWALVCTPGRKHINLTFIEDNRNLVCILRIHSSGSVRGYKIKYGSTVLSVHELPGRTVGTLVFAFVPTANSFHGLSGQNSHVFNLLILIF